MFSERYRLYMLCLLLGGCVSVPATDYVAVEQQVQARLPDRTISLDQAAARVPTPSAWLSSPLTPELAMRIALLNNQSLQAGLMQLGIAQADVVQAGLLSNPTLAVSALRPDAGGRWQLDLGLTQNVLELLTRSLRQTLAEAAYEQVELAVSQQLLANLQSIRSNYYAAVAARHKAGIAEQLAQAAANAATLSRQFYTAGNIPEREHLQERVAAQTVQLVADAATRDAAIARVELARQLGIADAEALQLPDQLPAYTETVPACEDLQQAAVNTRLDLQQLQLVHVQAAHQLALVEKNGGLTELDVGVNAEREFDGSDNAGPSVALSLPVFDQGQARIAAQRWHTKKTAADMQALQASIPHEVAQACIRRDEALQRVERLRQSVIPHQERIVELTLREYNFMLVDASVLLQAKQAEYQSYLDYIDAVGVLWMAHAALGKAVGSDAALVAKTDVVTKTETVTTHQQGVTP